MKLDLADVRPSLVSWAIVGIMAVTFIILAKWAVAKWPIPGVTELINAV